MSDKEGMSKEQYERALQEQREIVDTYVTGLEQQNETMHATHLYNLGRIEALKQQLAEARQALLTDKPGN